MIGRGMIRLVAATILSGALPAHAEWQEAASRHFVVYSDDDPARVRDFTLKLERFDKAIRALRGVPNRPVSPNARVSVYVVRNIAAVQKLANGASGVAGFYVPRASQSVAFVPRNSGGDIDALTILLHEYTHHFTFTTWGNSVLPAWLVEGMAEYHAAALFADDGGVTLGGVAKYRAYGLTERSILPMKRLLVADPNTLNAVEQTVFYARSWLLTHYMTMDKERRERLSRYIAAINAGAAPEQAIAQLGDPSDLDRALNAYVTKKYISSFVIPAAEVAPGPVTIRALSPGEAATMPARIASTRGVDRRTAPGVAALARKLAAPYPADAGAQNVLAEAAFDAGDFAAARAAAERALTADPSSVHAMMYAGLSRMAVAGKGDAAAWKAARAWFSRANRIDTEYAWPLQMFYGSYVAEGKEPTANAQDGLLYARALAPFDPALGMTAAYVLLKRGQAKEAATILKPIAYNPHGGALAAAASAITALIDKGGTQAALAMLDRRDGSAAASSATDTAAVDRPLPPAQKRSETEATPES